MDSEAVGWDEGKAKGAVITLVHGGTSVASDEEVVLGMKFDTVR